MVEVVGSTPIAPTRQLKAQVIGLGFFLALFLVVPESVKQSMGS
jgi:hypothetical protein